MALLAFIIVNGGDLVSTWITKLKVHVEEVTILVKNVTKDIVANKPSNFGVSPINDRFYNDALVLEQAA